MKPFLRRAWRSAAALTSGLSLKDLEQVELAEFDSAVSSAQLRRRALLPVDLVGPSAPATSPMSPAERAELRSLLLPLLAAPVLPPSPWVEGQRTYRGVSVTDPFLDLPAEELEKAPLGEIFWVHAGYIQRLTAEGSSYYADPERRLETWALQRLFDHSESVTYRLMNGNKPF